MGAGWGWGTSEKLGSGIWEGVLSPAMRGGLKTQRRPCPLQALLDTGPLKLGTAEQLSED